MRQQRLAPRLFAVFLQFGAGAMFLFDLPHGSALPWLNVGFLGCAMVAFAGLFSAAYIERHAAHLRPYERGIGHALLIWGVLWWTGAGLMQIDDHVVDSALRPHASLSWFALSSALLATVARRVQWTGGAHAQLRHHTAVAAVRAGSARFIPFAAREVRLSGLAARIRRSSLRIASARDASAAGRAVAACDQRVGRWPSSQRKRCNGRCSRRCPIRSLGQTSASASPRRCCSAPCAAPRPSAGR